MFTFLSLDIHDGHISPLNKVLRDIYVFQLVMLTVVNFIAIDKTKYQYPQSVSDSFMFQNNYSYVIPHCKFFLQSFEKKRI